MVKFAKNITRSIVTIIAVTMAMLIIAAPIRAQGASLNLPSSTVNVIVQHDNVSYFVTTLSNVPGGYDVTNTTYPGWCIDYSVTMTRNEAFEAQLYSSLNPPSGTFANVQWDIVNYILNSALAKATGNFTETQDCIWYFVNNSATYTHTLDTNETLIIQDALTRGAGFIPAPGQSVAVIVFPEYVEPGQGPFQDSIIQVPMPQPLTFSESVTGDIAPTSGNTYEMNQGATAYFAAYNVVGGIQPYSYAWYVNGTLNTTNQEMAFTEDQTGTYVVYVTVSDSSSPPQNETSQTCYVDVVSPSQTPLFVNATVTGQATLIATNTYQMYQGATAYFAANAVGGTQPYSYTWYVNGTMNTTNQTMTFTPQQTGTYIIYVNATDSSTPPQIATSTNYTVLGIIPEYPLLGIVLIALLATPLIITVRRKKNRA